MLARGRRLHAVVERQFGGSLLQRDAAGRRLERLLLPTHVPVQTAGKTSEPVAHLVSRADGRHREDGGADAQSETNHKMRHRANASSEARPATHESPLLSCMRLRPSYDTHAPLRASSLTLICDENKSMNQTLPLNTSQHSP